MNALRIDFGKRLLEEVKGMSPTNTTIRLFAAAERNRCAWMGGSLLASLSPFKEMWLSKKEYEEGGAAALFKKALM